MSIIVKNVRRFCWLMVPLIGTFKPILCQGHDWPVHMKISEVAFAQSDGLNAFIQDNAVPPFLSVNTPEADGPLTPSEWLQEGARMEDEQVYPLLNIYGLTVGHHVEQRPLDHFYTVLPGRTPGQAIGLNDFSEPSVIGSIFSVFTQTVNSYSWATETGIIGPANVGLNVYKWSDARNYEFAALTSTNQSDRDGNAALMFYTLGHILHLNQDLTSPDHARDANHYNTAYIEDYGDAHYEQNPSWFVISQNATSGWTNWQSQGFSKLLDFWDRGLYGGTAQPLIDSEDPSQPTKKLGLAEWSNGNFLGETALYKECYDPSDRHYFPFPSLYSSTTYSSKFTDLANSGLRTVFLANGLLVNRIYLDKIADGITFTNHSVVSYLGIAVAQRGTVPRSSASVPIQNVSVSIHDPSVLQAYHNLLIPKAVEYSAGILDYFFRGTIDVTATFNANSDQYTFVVQNTSSQDFGRGSFFLVTEDTNNVRTIVQTNFFSTVPINTSIDFTYSINPPGPVPQGTKFLVVYQGTNGIDSSGNALDPVDTNCIAVGWPFKQTIIYTYQPSLDSLGLTNGSTIISNLASGDFYFTPTPGNYTVTINQAYFDDNGSIGCDTNGVDGISAPLATDCGWPHDPITSTVVPAEDVTIVGNHLQVNITATDNGCGVQIGWVDVSITWRAWPAP